MLLLLMLGELLLVHHLLLLSEPLLLLHLKILRLQAPTTV